MNNGIGAADSALLRVARDPDKAEADVRGWLAAREEARVALGGLKAAQVALAEGQVGLQVREKALAEAQALLREAQDKLERDQARLAIGQQGLADDQTRLMADTEALEAQRAVDVKTKALAEAVFSQRQAEFGLEIERMEGALAAGFAKLAENQAKVQAALEDIDRRRVLLAQATAPRAVA